MTAEFWPGDREPQLLPSERLVLYVNGQFLDAIQKEESEGSRDQTSLNGTFIQRVPTESQHPLLRGSRRIVLKPPHPNDLPGYFCEAYAVRLDEEARALTHREYMSSVDFYVLRDYIHGRPGPYYIVSQAGVYPAEAEDTIGKLVDDSVKVEDYDPNDQAHLFLAQFTRYNIVAISE